jgi:hypothetical protein
VLWEEYWTSENKTQTQVVEERKWASTLDLSKTGTDPIAQGCWFLCLRMQKQASGKDRSRHGS